MGHKFTQVGEGTLEGIFESTTHVERPSGITGVPAIPMAIDLPLKIWERCQPVCQILETECHRRNGINGDTHGKIYSRRLEKRRHAKAFSYV